MNDYAALNGGTHRYPRSGPLTPKLSITLFNKELVKSTFSRRLDKAVPAPK